MQNFTLGKRGLPMLLFALTLLIGTLPSFGQDCASVEDEDPGTPGNQQSFCYLQTVEEIERTGTNTAIFESADTANDTQPIDSDELLTDGITYYVGSTSEDCDRVAVEVSVTAADTPDNSLFPGEDDFTLSPCESSDFTAEDLEDLFTADAGPNYFIEAYTSEFGEQTAEGELVPGESYFVAQVSSVDGECPSTRAAVGYDPIEAPTPIAEPAQTFCEGATVADLVAQGTEDNTQAIRWYRSATSNSPLADNVQLVNGEDYFASQIVNDRDDPFPPCETPTDDRARVIVEILKTDAPAAEAEQAFCQVDNPTVTDLEAAGENLTWYEDAALTIVANESDALVNGEDYFVTQTITGCESEATQVTVIVDETPGAPAAATAQSFCEGDSPTVADLQATGENLTWYEDAALTTVANASDPLVNGEDYFVTQTNSSGCESQATQVTVSILPSPDAGADNSATYCEAEIQAEFDGGKTFENLFEELLEDGVSGGNFESIPDYSGLGTYNATYTIESSNGCEDSAAITIVVDDPDAGEDNTSTEFCRSEFAAQVTEDQVRDFFLNLLSDGATSGGTFSDDSIEEITAAFNNGTGIGEFSTTYTVGEGACQDEAFLSVTVLESPDAGADNSATYCEAEVEARLASPTTDFEDLFEELLEDGVTGGSFSPTPVYSGPGTYTSTYTITLDNGCTDSASITVIVESPNAGEDTDLVFCQNEFAALLANPALLRAELIDLIGEDVDTSGDFTNDDLETMAAQYAAAVNANAFPFIAQTTYTVTTETGCTNSSDLTLTVNPSPNAGDDGSVTVSREDDQFNLFTELEGNPDTGGTWSPGNADGSFDPATGESGVYTYTVTNEFGCSDSATVTVTVTTDPTECEGIAGSDNTGTVFCRSELNASYSAEEVEAFFRSLLSEDAQSGGTFSPDFATIADNFNNGTGVGVFSTTYTVGEGDCQDSATLSVTVNETEDADAGTIENVTVACESEELIVLASLPNEGGNTGGTFSGEGVTNETFDPSVGPGTYTITYSVDETADCVTPGTSAETTFTITVDEEASQAEVGPIANQETCVDGETINLATLLNEDNTTLGGTFTGTGVEDGMFDPAVAGAGTFTITYEVDGDELACIIGEASNTFTITVDEEASQAEVGPIANQETCVDGETINLATLLNEDNTTLGGTFTGTGVEDGMFDPAVAGAGTFTITYEVDGDELACIIGEASNTFTITVDEEASQAEVGPIANQETCVDGETINLATLLNEDNTTLGGTFTGTGVEDGMFDPAVAGAGTFTITYEVDGDELACIIGEASNTFTITVDEEASQAEVGPIANQETCVDGETINLATLLNEDNTTLGGTFTGTGVEDGMFDPAVAGAGTFTITYEVDDSADCVTPGTSAETTFTITVQSSFDLGEPIALEMCITEVQAMVANPQLAIDLFNDAIAERTNGDLSGEFSPSIETLAGQIATYLSNPTPSQTFETTYSVSTDCGDDSVLVSLTINDVTEATTGDIADFQVCEADSTINLFDRLTDANTMGGIFSTEDGEIVDGLFDISQMGEYTVTYTVSEDLEEACVEGTASTQFTITVTEGEEASLEPIANSNVCLSEDGFNLSTFVSGNTPGGTFTSGNGTITGNNLDVSEAGTYNITYTVADSDPNTCLTGTASETFTITVGGNANAGADNSLEVCNEDVDNLSNTAVRNLYLDLLDEGVSTDGTFNPTIEELMNQYNTVSNFGDFTTTYTVGNGDCQDSTVLTVTVIEANDAGDDVTIALCTTGEAVDLFDYLSPLATTNGTFEGFEDGVFDPADAELGDTVITYEVPEDDSVCSTGNFTATFTITVSEQVAANAGDDVTIEYCSELNEEIDLSSLLSEGAIAAGTFSAPFANGTFNPSVSGEGVYVVTYTLDGVACTTGTDSSTITITVVGDTEAPVADAEQTFCFVDEPTVGDIVVTGEGVVIYEDAELTTPADATDPLVNGVSYFASFSESAACASGVTMITVTIQDSDAPTLVIDGDEFCRQDNPTVQELINNLNGTGIQIYLAVTGGTALATTTLLENGVTYFASGTDSEGACESSERFAVQVEVEFCGIPEGFSPNGDDKNDFFVIEDIATDYPNYELEVYNRWGSLVFEGNASTGDWDGTSNQSATLGDGVLPTGFYFYILNYNDGQTKPVQGKVYLSR